MSPTVAELLRDAAFSILSFRFFPSRTPEEQPRFEAAVAKLDRFHPAFLLVTYGASGSIRGRTVAATAALGNAQYATIVGHLTYVSQFIDNLLQTFDAFTGAGVSDIPAIRGDVPGGPQQPWERHPGGLGNATELVRLIEAHDGFCVGVAVFPNVHRPGSNPRLSTRIIAEKTMAGTDYAIAQLFSESHRYVELANRVHERGSQIPIIPGIAPLAVITQIERLASLADCPLPKDFVTALRATRNPAEVRSMGLSRAINLCWELLAAEAPGFQFSTQNRWKAIPEVLDTIDWGDRVN